MSFCMGTDRRRISQILVSRYMMPAVNLKFAAAIYISDDLTSTHAWSLGLGDSSGNDTRQMIRLLTIRPLLQF